MTFARPLAANGTPTPRLPPLKAGSLEHAAPAPSAALVREIDENAAAAQLTLTVQAIRRLARAGGLDVVSGPGMPLRIRLELGQTNITLLYRMLDRAETPTDRGAALRLRQKVACLDHAMRVRYPLRFQDAAVAITVATGLGLTRANLHAVLRATSIHLEEIIARAAAEGVPIEASRLPSTPPLPPPGYRNLDVNQASEQLGISRQSIRRLAALGRLDVVSGEAEPLLVRLAEAETRQSLLRTTLNDGPDPFTREAALRHRDEVSALSLAHSVRSPEETEKAAIALLAAEGSELNVANLRTVLWGDNAYVRWLIRQTASAGAKAERLSQPDPIPPEGLHDVTVWEAAWQMGLFHRTMCRLNRTNEFQLFQYNDGAIRTRLPVNATRASTLARLLAEPPEPFNRQTASNYREKMACLDQRQRTRFSREFEDMCVAILRKEGARIDHAGLKPLIWGTKAYLDRIALRANHLPDETIGRTVLAASAEIGRRAISVAVELGVICERERGPRNIQQFEFAVSPSRDDINAALLALQPAKRGKSMFRQYAGLRRALDWAALDDHPAGILEDTADYLRSKGQKATVSTMLRLIRGNPDQIGEFLIGYFERNGIDAHVQRPRARKGDALTQKQFVDRLVPELRQLWGTGLDDKRGSTILLPTELDLKHLGAIKNDRIFQPAAAITLHARRLAPVPERQLHQALRAIRNLEIELGDDFGSISIVGAVLAAWIEVPGPAASLRPKLSDAVGWKSAVALMSGLMKRLPSAERAAILPHRLAPPAGSAGFFRNAYKLRRTLTHDASNNKANRLEDLLNDPQWLLELALQVRSRTRALCESVINKCDETLMLGGAFPIVGSLAEEFTNVSTGQFVKQRAVYEVHRWTDIYDRLITAGALGADELPGPSGRAVPADKADLFENNFVVANYRCIGAENFGFAPLSFVRQFETGIFHPFQQMDEAETNVMMASMAEHGLAMVDREAPSALWTFEGQGRRRMALLAQRHLGLTLLPITELNHGQQYAMLAMSTNFDWPTRSGELIQHRLDEGKFRIFREGGIPGAILAYKAVRKYGKHFGDGEEDFYMFERSIGLQRELLGTTIARFFPAGGMPSFPAIKTLQAKGIIEGHFTYSTGKGLMRPEALSVLINLMLAGTARIKLRDGKEFWTALSRRSGLPLDLRRRASGHVGPDTTLGYGTETALEVENLQHELAKARALACSTNLRVVPTPNVASSNHEDETKAHADAEDAVAALYEARGLLAQAAHHRQEAARIRSGGIESGPA